MNLDFITTEEMKTLEINSEYYGLSRLQLMENAGCSVAEEIAARFSNNGIKVEILCGLGGNGGDGFVAARHLSISGFEVKVVIAGKKSQISNLESKKNFEALEILGQDIVIEEAYDSSLVQDLYGEVLVDALLGTGLSRPLGPPISDLVRRINQAKGFKVSIDIPSGIDSDTGEKLGEAVKADLTISLHKAKLGLLKAKECVGELIVKSIGIPNSLESFVGPGNVYQVLKPRSPRSHKGDFGRLLVIGGNEKFSGAPILTALAALRTGIDLVFVAAPIEVSRAIRASSPDLIALNLEGEHLNMGNISDIQEILEKSDAIVVGPGLGLHDETGEAVKYIIHLAEEKRIPLLLDADGLKIFASDQHPINSSVVLTPHEGEYKLMSEKVLPEELTKRAEAVRNKSKELNSVILLKSNIDIISDGTRTKFNFTGNPGMTVGGTGDILAGIVGALLSQKNSPLKSATAGAFINGAAGDFVYSEKGFHIVASDLLEYISNIMIDPMCHKGLRTNFFQSIHK